MCTLTWEGLRVKIHLFIYDLFSNSDYRASNEGMNWKG